MKESEKGKSPPFEALRLSEAIEKTITVGNRTSIEKLMRESEFKCLSENIMVLRVDKQFVTFVIDTTEELEMRAFYIDCYDDLVSFSFGYHGELSLLLPNCIMMNALRGGKIAKNTVKSWTEEQKFQNPYKQIVTVTQDTIFLLQNDNILGLHRIIDDKLVEIAKVDLKTKVQLTQISKIYIQKRNADNKYMGLMVAKLFKNGVFESQTLYALQICQDDQLDCHFYDILAVRIENYLKVSKFLLHSQQKEYLEVCLNNQILIICKFIQKYMIWQSIYHKKIKEESITNNIGLCKQNYFYVIQKLCLQLYRFTFVQDKKNLRTILKVDLQHFLTDETSTVRQPFNYCQYVSKDKLLMILLNCQLKNDKLHLYLRTSVKCTLDDTLNSVVSLIGHHQQFQKELNKVVDFVALKSGQTKQEVGKQIWTRWPKVLQKGSHSIRKLLQVNDAHYIQKQLQLLFKKGPLRIDLVQDIMSKCEALYRYELTQDFNHKTVRRYIKCNFKCKKVRLYMQICKSKQFTQQQYEQIKRKDMDQEIKSFLPQFRRVDLQLAMSIFSDYFLLRYQDILSHSFRLIKDIMYFVSNFNFLFPLPNRPDIWQFNIDRKEHEITKDKIMRIWQYSKKKPQSFQEEWLKARKDDSKFMVNNDVFYDGKALTTPLEAYHMFFCALIYSSNTLTLEDVQKVLKILSQNNGMDSKVKIHIGCIINIHYAMDHLDRKLDLMAMFKMPPQELFQKLIELKHYQIFTTVVKSTFDQLEENQLSQSFQRYLSQYICKKVPLNQHFNKILDTARELPQNEYEAVLETMLDCMYFSMEICQADQIQAYVEQYFLIDINSQRLRQKLLRLQNILGQEDLFLQLDSHLKLLSIELGTEVFSRKIEKFIKQNLEQLNSGKISSDKISQLFKELEFLKEEYYQDEEDLSLIEQLLKNILDKVENWKLLVDVLIQQHFKNVQQSNKTEVLKKLVEEKKQQIYKKQSVCDIVVHMNNLIKQYNDEKWKKMQRIRLDFIVYFEQFEILNMLPSVLKINEPRQWDAFRQFIDSQNFKAHKNSDKVKFVQLLYGLSPDKEHEGLLKQSQMQSNELVEACEAALQNNDYEKILQYLNKQINRTKEEFSVNFKVVWIKFMGQLIHDLYWNNTGLFILQKCLYTIVDFKESMQEFFSLLATANEDDSDQPQALQFVKIRSPFLRKKGSEWVIKKLRVTELKMKKMVKSKNILQFMFRHLLISDHVLAFAFINSNLKHIDIGNAYKMTIISLESDYFTHKLDIVTRLINTICKCFALQYPTETASFQNTSQMDYLKLILKLKPNAKDEESRNKLEFYQNIIKYSSNLKSSYEVMKIHNPDFSNDVKTEEVKVEAILCSLSCFSQSLLPMLKSSSHSAVHDDLEHIQIGEVLVSSSDGESE